LLASKFLIYESKTPDVFWFDNILTTKNLNLLPLLRTFNNFDSFLIVLYTILLSTLLLSNKPELQVGSIIGHNLTKLILIAQKNSKTTWFYCLMFKMFDV